MLTFNLKPKIKRNDRPWLLFVIAVIWVFGTMLFHSPWEPFEPFVFAVVKGIIKNNSWLVPYISNTPYLDIQPFYFWIYAAIVKLFNLTDANFIANLIRVINTLFIFSILVIVGQIGSKLSAFKNGRTVVLVLISSVGFINTSYQLSPNILVILGLCLYLYSLSNYQNLPGISSWLLFMGLLLLSVNFTCAFVLLGIIILLLLPLIDKSWRTRKYFFTVSIGTLLFLIIFYLYGIQLRAVNSEFYLQWAQKYTALFENKHFNFLVQFWKTIEFLTWYLIPSGFLVIWTIIKRKKRLFQDKLLLVNLLWIILLLVYCIFSGYYPESILFPIVICCALVASVEVDSIKITIVSLLNWFSIFTFGLVGLLIWCVFISFNFAFKDNQINNFIIQYGQNYIYHYNFWNFIVAAIITVIWLFMITRSHIRGREMITNWASGSTFIIILFLALFLPWFDSVLTFKPIVTNSLHYIDKNKCIVTNGYNGSQIPLWYYYADINLLPSFLNLDYSLCNQAILATDNLSELDQKQWKIVWQAKRPIDKKVYYVVKHK